MKKSKALRGIPAVEHLLQRLAAVDLPRPMLARVVRSELAAIRRSRAVPERGTIEATVRAAAERLARSRLRTVINGTGVILHTNLGRAPLGDAVIESLGEVGRGYTNLEMDLSLGERGSRGEYAEEGLAVLCGAEAACVVNNCAAALILILRHLVRGERKEVVISRGELVQIGGGFRIPEILEVSGAVLREVGTTNRTSVADYSKAVGPKTAMLLRVHRSNFFMGGFVESPAREDLVAIGRKKRVPVVEDLGSGAMVATETLSAVGHEPTPMEVLKAGVDLTCFSGDKLMGGVQAGVIAGRVRHVRALKKEPFFRALRCDKLILGALQAVVDSYLGSGGDRGAREPALPVLAMLAEPVEVLRRRAEVLAGALAREPVVASIGSVRSRVGGGTLPEASVESVSVDLEPRGLGAVEFARRLRLGRLPVIGNISGGKLRLDLRTIIPWQDEPLVDEIRSALVAESKAG